MLKQMNERNANAEKEMKERIDKEIRIKNEASKALTMQMKAN